MADRLVDIPIESLPFIDEHYIDIAAGTQQVWDALLETLTSAALGRRGRTVARLLGCAQTRAHGDVGTVGSTIPGFLVTRSIPPAVLALMGRHRFAQYALIFRIVEKPSGLVLLSAQTRAEFPGPHGKTHRALVLGTRGHVFAIRSLLRRVRRRAERASYEAPGGAARPPA